MKPARIIFTATETYGVLAVTFAAHRLTR